MEMESNGTVALTDLTSFSGYGTFMAVVGTVGNLLSLAVALRPKVRGTSFSIFLSSLAIADSLVLWSQAFLLLTYYNVSEGFCVSRPFLLMYPEAQANWIIAGLTLERALLINYPLKATAIGLGKQKSGCLFVGTILVVALAFHFPTLFFLSFDSTKDECTVRNQLKYAAEELYPWLTVAIFFYLPMMVIVMCNVGIIRTLLKTSMDKAKNSPTSDKAQHRIRRIAVTVSIVSVVYVVLEFCNALIRTQLATKDIKDASRPPPQFFASMMACQTNHAINIILYCLSGAQFREEFFKLLRILCCLGKQSKDSPQKSSSKASDNLTASSTASSRRVV